MARSRQEVAAANAKSHPNNMHTTFANDLGVELATLHGTGAGGRVTRGDIRVAAGLPRDARAAALARADRAYGATVASDEGGPLGRNPLVAQARVSDFQMFTAASAKSPPPTLFVGGDLPPFTASGLAPQVLLSVPWNARHALAQAPTSAAAYRILAEFEGIAPQDAETVADLCGFSSVEGAQRYRRDVASWLAASKTADEVYVAMGFAADEATRRAKLDSQAAALKPITNSATAKQRTWHKPKGPLG